MAVALVALFIALGGTGYAASRIASSQKPSKGWATHSLGRRGLRGRPGPQGLQGTTGLQGVPGTARAYGFYRWCSCVFPPFEHPSDTYFPPALHKNVTFQGSRQGSPEGTYCFGLEGGIDASNAIVVASAEGAKTTGDFPGSPTSLESAQWVQGAPDCSPNQIEIQTVRYTADATGLVATHDGGISFSFVIP